MAKRKRPYTTVIGAGCVLVLALVAFFAYNYIQNRTSNPANLSDQEIRRKYNCDEYEKNYKNSYHSPTDELTAAGYYCANPGQYRSDTQTNPAN